MSALVLRSIAAIAMLLDHIGLCFGIFPLRIIGRIAFPLYVFLLVNGFHHTKNRKNYALRFFLFAIISQIPFQLMRYARIRSFSDFLNKPSLFLDNLNVMVTLLVALLAIWLCDTLRKGKFTRYLCLLPSVAAFFLYYLGFIRSDYGAKGVLLATAFWFFEGKKLLTALGLFVSMFYDVLLRYCFSLVKNLPFALGIWDYINLAILLILPLIFLYNGKSGMPTNLRTKKTIQSAFYAFYPVHMLLLWTLVQIMA